MGGKSVMGGTEEACQCRAWIVLSDEPIAFGVDRSVFAKPAEAPKRRRAAGFAGQSFF